MRRARGCPAASVPAGSFCRGSWFLAICLWICACARAFGLDRSGATRRLLARYYRRVAQPCRRPVLLARGAGPRPDPGLREPCGTLPTDGFDLDF